MVTSESEEKKYTKLEEDLLKIIYLGSDIDHLHATEIKTNNRNAKLICRVFSMLKIYEFIRSYETLENHAPENKKYLFELSHPLFEILLKCKGSLQQYRNKRIAHMDALDTNSEDFFTNMPLPTTSQGNIVFYEIVEILMLLISSGFFDYLPNMCEKLKKQNNNYKHIPRKNIDEELRAAKNKTWSKMLETQPPLPSDALCSIYTKLSVNVPLTRTRILSMLMERVLALFCNIVPRGHEGIHRIRQELKWRNNDHHGYTEE